MRVGRPILVISLLFLAFLISCRPKDAAPTEKGAADAPPEEPARIIAASTVDRLRVRSLPYLDEDIVTFLSVGDSVVVESRTEWNQELDDMASPWYFIRTETNSGWTYGGFLKFTGDDRAAVPVNPALPPPAAVPDAPSEGPIDVTRLPEILLPVFGVESEPPPIPGDEGTIGYDPMLGNLIIPFREGADSGLAAYASGSGTLRLEAKHVSGVQFEHVFSGSDAVLYSSAWGYFGGTGRGEAILLPFHRLASLPGGAWEFYAFAGNENWPAAIGKAEISPGEVSLSTAESPNPMTDSPHVILKSPGRIYCFGTDGTGSGYREVALYHDSAEIRDEQVLLRPVAARRVAVDSRGRWNTVFQLAGDIPEGRYWTAVGDPIEDLEDVKLFITSLEIRP